MISIHHPLPLSLKYHVLLMSIKDGTSDPEHFMSISEIEELWSKLNASTKVLYSDLTESLLKQINQKALIDQKKENSKPEE